MDDGYAAHTFLETPEELLRIKFFKAIDSAVMNLDEAFQSADLNLLASTLITGNVNSSVING